MVVREQWIYPDHQKEEKLNLVENGGSDSFFWKDEDLSETVVSNIWLLSHFQLVLYYVKSSISETRKLRIPV